MNRRHFIGLGGNMGNRHALLDTALNEIQMAFPCVQERSSRFETPAWGMAPGTPAFLNQVISDLIAGGHRAAVRVGRIVGH